MLTEEAKQRVLSKGARKSVTIGGLKVITSGPSASSRKRTSGAIHGT